MWKHQIVEYLRKEAKTITIEPILFLNAFGISTVMGAQITTNLLIRKICLYELRYSEDVCNHLDLHLTADEEVEKNVNNFQMNSQWIASVPIIIFSIIAGALSDEFGRVKPLILIPLIGNLLSGLMSMVSCALIDVVPLEFFYLENIGAFFGSYAVFYLGVYSYGTKVTQPDERARRLARFDGSETLGKVLGFLASPLIFAKLGYQGNFGICGGMLGLSIIYAIFFVEEPKKALKEEIEKKEVEKKPRKSCLRSVFDLTLSAFIILKDGLISLVTRRRKRIIKGLILIQLVCFTIYWLCVEINVLMYLYMMLVFVGFTADDYSYFVVTMSLLNAFCLFVLMPIISGKMKLHDSMILFIISLIETLSSALTPLATQLWHFYLVQGVAAIGYCKYSVLRSLLSKYIYADEVGKVFSLLAVLAALAPVAGNPIFRQLYNFTLDSFPSAVYLLCAAFFGLAGMGNLALFLTRHEMKKDDQILLEDKEEDENLDESFPSFTVD